MDKSAKITRSSTTRRPPSIFQETTAIFLAFGCHEARLKNLKPIYLQWYPLWTKISRIIFEFLQRVITSFTHSFSSSDQHILMPKFMQIDFKKEVCWSNRVIFSVVIATQKIHSELAFHWWLVTKLASVWNGLNKNQNSFCADTYTAILDIA